MNDTIIHSLLKRAKTKWLTFPVTTHLIALDSPLKDKYISSLGCSSMVRISEGTSKSRYCKRPWCSTCNRIRMAVRLNNYRKELEALGCISMTTLTLPNVPEKEIGEAIRRYRSIFRQYRNTYKKKYKEVFAGTYTLEITYNQRSNMYHPHIHIIHQKYIRKYQLTIGDDTLSGAICAPLTHHFVFTAVRAYRYFQNHADFHKDLGNDLINYWLDHLPEASPLAQDTRNCWDLIEGFKYSVKGIGKIKTPQGKQDVVFVRELDAIYQATEGMHLFQPFGIKKNSIYDEEKEMDKLQAQATDKPEAVYLWNKLDWFASEIRTSVHEGEIYQDITISKSDYETLDETTGEMAGVSVRQLSTPLALSGFKPNKRLINLYENYTNNHYYQQSDNFKERTAELPGPKVPEISREALQDIFSNVRKARESAFDNGRLLQAGRAYHLNLMALYPQPLENPLQKAFNIKTTTHELRENRIGQTNLFFDFL